MTRRAFLLATFVVAAIATSPSIAGATAKITEPASDPYAVAAQAGDAALPFTIVATGYRPGSLVFVEQCDGTSPTASNWSPTLDCDIGSSPAPAIVDSHGTAKFAADDRNHAFHPFVGASPQQVFNCVAPGAATPHNTLHTFTNCRVRVSSSNTAVTPDQTFLVMTLPGAQSTTRSSSSHTAVIVAIVLVALLLVAGGLWWMTRRRPAATARRR